MAPRTAKAKKATDVSEAPKKGRGKAKAIEETEPEIDDPSVDDKAPIEKKKRGKKVIGDSNGQEENGKEENAPPAKKGRKKAEEPERDDMSEELGEEEATTPTELEEETVESNGDAKEAQTAGKGQKKGKKVAEKKVVAKPTRGRKAKQENESDEGIKEEVDEKPKPAAKGRGRKAQAKPEADTEKDEEVPETKGRGRKKAPAKKEKTPESEKEIDEEEKQEEEEEEVPAEEPKKKETKGRKNQSKKTAAKEESQDDETNEETAPATKKRKVNKKEEKAKGDTKEDEDVEDDVKPEPKAKRGRGKKAAEPAEEAQDAGDATNKRKRKPTEDKDKKPPAKNKAATDYDTIDFTSNSKSKEGKDWNFKISSWNVDGIRAWMNKGGLDYLKYEKPDILCLQEVKCSDEKLPEEVKNLAGYHAYWLCSERDGYAGVGLYTTQLAMNVQYGLQDQELDDEGRIITAEYEQFYLVCVYVPNAGRKLVTLPKRLQWNDQFRKHVKELDKKKPVIICGDMNVSHNEIDLANPKTNKKNAGFTEEERAGMTELLGEGFVDTFRHLYPDKTGAYTFWTYMMNSRAKNVGWRLDYFIVSERLLPALCDNVIRDEVYGSDHCPITLYLHLTSADKPKE